MQQHLGARDRDESRRRPRDRHPPVRLERAAVRRVAAARRGRRTGVRSATGAPGRTHRPRHPRRRAELRSTYLGLVRASDTGDVGSVLRQMHDQQFVAPLLAVLEGPDRELRARLAASMVGGLMYSLWTVEDHGLLGAEPAVIIAAYAPALQLLLTPPASG
ncbi:hypothetical protein [Mesorhizobium japonicum]|uniref:TetR/AcrR family transcriptional regulator n=1 Tax=Mesorhizobium japonicum TaxID=2066070 RepID=UPI003B5C7346